MPSNWLNIDISFPNFTGQESSEQQVRQMLDYLRKLVEQLRYNFRHLDIPGLDAEKIVSGVLKARHGGTGAATAMANRILAGPASGEAAEPSFRELDPKDIPDLDAGKITSGSFAAARIPNLAASKITSGLLAIARGGTGVATAAANKIFAGPASGNDAAPSWRALVEEDIPNLDAGKITSGSFAAARIPNLNASKITAGLLAIARGGTGAATAAANKIFAGPASGNDAAPSWRALVAEDIPSLAASKITSGTFAAERIPSLAMSKITGLAGALAERVAKDGATMTGNLTFTGGHGVYDRHGSAVVGTAPSATTYNIGHRCTDKNGTTVGYFRTFYSTDGAIGAQLEITRAVNGENRYHNLTLRMLANGTRQVTVSDRAPWLSGLGLAPTNITGDITRVTTMPTGVSKINTLIAWRSGYVVQVYISVVPTSAGIGSWVTIATGLPVPALAPIVNGRYWANSNTQPSLFQVDANGNLQVAWGASGANQACTLVYIAKGL